MQISLLVFSVLHALIAGWFAFPYFLLPSDDRSFLLDPNPHSPRPVFMALLWTTKKIATAIGWEEAQAWWILLTIAFGISTYLLMRLAAGFNRLGPWIVGILFVTNSWTGAYFFWGNYAPISFALCLAAVALAESSCRTAHTFLIGVLLSLYFWSSPSGLLWALVFSAAYFRFRGKLFIGRVWLSFTLGILLGWPSSGRKILTHWQDNLDGVRFQQFTEVMGFSASPPLGSFFAILAVHQELLLGLFFLTMGIYGWRYRSFPRVGRFLILALMHLALIDALPFTKLGRSHYPALPLLILFIGIVLGETGNHPRFRRLVPMLLVLFVTGTACQGLYRTLQVRKAKQMAWVSIKRFPLIHFLKDDLHAWYFAETARAAGIPYRVIEDLKYHGEERLLLLGPHGPGSGRTVLRASVAPDWNYSLRNLADAGFVVEKSWPTSFYLPAFAMESEFSQALYFHGNWPEPESENRKLLLWRQKN